MTQSAEMLGEPLDDLDIRSCGILSVIPTLEFLQYLFA
jgi:hypothetical protein